MILFPDFCFITITKVGEVMAYDVTCVFPDGENVSKYDEKMAALSPDKAELDWVRELVAAGKKHATVDPVQARRYLDELDCPYLTLAPDRKRTERYYRVGFLGMEVRIG